MFLPILLAPPASSTRHISARNSILWLESGRAYAFTRKVNLLAASIWNQKSIWFLKTDIDSYFNNSWKKKVKANERSISLCFLSSEWICIWRVPKTQTHSAYMCVLPSPHKRLFPYALDTEYICASFTTPQGTGTRWMIYATYLPTSLWHNLFLFSSSL